jgi:omega-6 fatty acid desaturase (delta-12 desaturase)
MKMNADILAITASYARENRLKSWRVTLSTFFLLATNLYLLTLDVNCTLRLPLSVLCGLLIVRMFVIYHDYLHQAILTESAFANILFTIFGYYVLCPKIVWQRSHNYHHDHNSKLFKSGIGSYPMFTVTKFNELNAKQQRQYLFIRHPFVIFNGFIFSFLIGMCIHPLIVSFSKNKEAILALVFYFTLHVFIFINFGWITSVFFTVIPHFISGGMGAYLFYAQHNFPTATYKSDEQWSYLDAAMESSSFMNTNPLMHWFTGNIGYHHIHHINARIPFYRLPEVMRDVPLLQDPKTTTLTWREIRNCLSLKLWDEESKRLVALSR